MVRVRGGGQTGQSQVRFHLQPILASGLIAWGVMVPVQCGRGMRCQQHHSCLLSRRSMYFALLIFVQAVRHGIARALQNWEPKLRPLLKTEGALWFSMLLFAVQ